MPLITSCTHCQKTLQVPDNAAGKAVRCPKCNGVFVVTPQGTPPPVAAAPAPPTPAPSAVKPSAPGAARPRPASPPQVPSVVPVKASVTARPSAPLPPPLPAAPSAAEDFDEAPSRRLPPLEFKVVVRRDPNKELKGTFQGSLSPSGLQLRQGKTLDLKIPVGTPVTYQGKNCLALPIDDRTVEVVLTRPNLYVCRLARDAAAFLRGERRPLDPRAYAMPIYLWLLPLLPLGIVFIGMNLKLFGTGFLPGALNGGLWGALGGGLAGLCWWIVQREQWPTGVRLGVAVGSSVVGYVILIGTALVMNSGPPPIPDAEWMDVELRADGCRILMPGRPQQQNQIVPTPVGPLHVDMYVVERKKEERAFVLAFSRLPAQQANAEQILDGVQQGAAKNLNGTVADQTPITLTGFSGREVTIRAPGKGTWLARYYLANGRLYQNVVFGKRIRRNSPDVQKFFDSFHLQEMVAQKKQPPIKVDPGIKPPVKPLPPNEQPKPGPDAQGRLFLKGPGGDVLFLQYLPDGRLFTGHTSGAGFVWSADGNQRKEAIRPFPPGVGPCTAYALTADGGLAMRAVHGGPIELWDVTAAQLKATLQPSEPGMFSIWSVALTPSGQWGASAHGHRIVKLWDIGGQKLQATLKGHKDQVCAVAFTPDGKTLVSAGWDQTLKFWDVASAKETATFDAKVIPLNWMLQLAFAPDGKTLAVWRQTGSVHLLDPATRVLRPFVSDGEVTATAFSGDSKSLATAVKNGSITLWDVGTGKKRGTLQTGKQAPRALAWSPDGKKLAVAFGGEIIIWDLERVKLTLRRSASPPQQAGLNYRHRANLRERHAHALASRENHPADQSEARRAPPQSSTPATQPGQPVLRF